MVSRGENNSGRPLSRDEICRRLRSVLGTFGIRRIVLFGSFARDTQTPDSDVDLIVVVDDPRRFFDRYEDILPMLHRVLRPHAVQPLIYTEQEYAAMLERPGGVVATAKKEGIAINV